MKAAKEVTECEGEIKWEEAERNGGCYSALFVLYMSIITYNLKHLWLKSFDLIENQYSQLHQLHLQLLQRTGNETLFAHNPNNHGSDAASTCSIINIQPKTFQTSLPVVSVVAQ